MKADVAPAGELAARIYVELVGRAVTLQEGGAKLAASPENLATLSFRLAEAFRGVHEALDAARVPKTAFNLEAADITGWSK